MPYGWIFIGGLVACALSLLAIDHERQDVERKAVIFQDVTSR